MGAKMGLLKNIVIDSFVILLACRNLVYSYSTLFLNGRQLSVLPDISTTFAMASLSTTGFLAWPLLLSLNLINLNPFWVNQIPDLNWEVMLRTLSCTTLSAILALLPPTASIYPTLFVSLFFLSK